MSSDQTYKSVMEKKVHLINNQLLIFSDEDDDDDVENETSQQTSTSTTAPLQPVLSATLPHPVRLATLGQSTSSTTFPQASSSDLNVSSQTPLIPVLLGSSPSGPSQHLAPSTFQITPSTSHLKPTTSTSQPMLSISSQQPMSHITSQTTSSVTHPILSTSCLEPISSTSQLLLSISSKLSTQTTNTQSISSTAHPISSSSSLQRTLPPFSSKYIPSILRKRPRTQSTSHIDSILANFPQIYPCIDHSSFTPNASSASCSLLTVVPPLPNSSNLAKLNSFFAYAYPVLFRDARKSIKLSVNLPQRMSSSFIPTSISLANPRKPILLCRTQPKSVLPTPFIQATTTTSHSIPIQSTSHPKSIPYADPLTQIMQCRTLPQTVSIFSIQSASTASRPMPTQSTIRPELITFTDPLTKIITCITLPKSMISTPSVQSTSTIPPPMSTQYTFRPKSTTYADHLTKIIHSGTLPQSMTSISCTQTTSSAPYPVQTNSTSFPKPVVFKAPQKQIKRRKLSRRPTLCSDLSPLTLSISYSPSHKTIMLPVTPQSKLAIDSPLSILSSNSPEPTSSTSCSLSSLSTFHSQPNSISSHPQLKSALVLPTLVSSNASSESTLLDSFAQLEQSAPAVFSEEQLHHLTSNLNQQIDQLKVPSDDISSAQLRSVTLNLHQDLSSRSFIADFEDQIRNISENFQRELLRVQMPTEFSSAQIRSIVSNLQQQILQLNMSTSSSQLRLRTLNLNFYRPVAAQNGTPRYQREFKIVLNLQQIAEQYSTNDSNNSSNGIND